MIINKYPASCSICKTKISSGNGFAFQKEGKWTPVCEGIQCVKRACPSELPSYESHMKKKSQKIKEEIDKPFDENAVKLAKKNGLFEYQVAGVKWLTQQENCLLGDEPGLGKSAQILIAHDEKYGMLAVVPSHLKHNWSDETKKWRPDLKITILKDGSSFAYPEPGEIVITSYGLLPWWLERAPRKRKNPMITDEEKEAAKNVVLVFDEVQALKNNSTKQTRKAKQLRELVHKTIGLTGTPIMNHELEIWNICSAIGIEKKIFESFPNFLRLFNGRKGKYGYIFANRANPEVPQILRRAMLRRKRDEVEIQLPSKIYKEIEVETPNTVKATLDNAWDLFRKSKYFEDDELPSLGAMSTEKKALAISKIPVLKKVVQDLEDQDIPIIVFTAHPKVAETIGKRKGWKYITGKGFSPEEKHKIATEFQDGKLKGLALTIKAAGTGLTLTRAHHVIFNDLDYVPANNVQAQDRCCRIGQQENKVILYHLVANHPLDRHIHRLLLQKMELAKSALDLKEETKEIEPSAQETEDDFRKRMERVEEEEREMRREAILSRLPLWMEDLGLSDAPSIDDEAAQKIRNKVFGLIRSSGVTIRRKGRQKELGATSGDLRILRLLQVSGMTTDEELWLANALIEKYQKNLGSNGKKTFDMAISEM